MDGSSRASSLLRRIYSARVSARTSSRFRHCRPFAAALTLDPSSLPRCGQSLTARNGNMHTYTIVVWDKKYYTLLEAVQRVDRDKRIKGKDALTSIRRGSPSGKRLTSTACCSVTTG